ncbi:MAG: tRNA lysidine(34) synthetase TilS [Ruminococcaceae bacterium]|nr:tRNA lysidine(34) synthetase TilS [Oscillospiraceae bacterium]
MNDFVKKVWEIICKRDLIAPGERVLVALSGGADSVCLLHVLKRLSETVGFLLGAAHLNHGLRGDEADEDEAFAASLCQQLDVPFFSCRCDVRALADQLKVGVEEAGRHARYDFFDALCQQKGFDKIATAHHAGDNVETVLMRLMRGTGPIGLAGIPYRNGKAIRPFLDVTRAEIEAYLSSKNLSFRIDDSNYSNVYTRNRIRHRLIPMIQEEFNPNFQKNFQKQIELYSACAAYIEQEVEQKRMALVQPILGGYSFSCSALRAESPFIVGQLLHQIITQLSPERELGMDGVQAVEDLLRQGKGRVSLTQVLTAQICYDILYIRRKDAIRPFCYPIRCKDKVFIKETGGIFHVGREEKQTGNKESHRVWVRAEALENKPLQLRSRREGDFFYPVGMTGRKTLREFFIDHKIPQFLRDTIPILTAGEDIVWIAGMRADRRFVSTQEKDQQLLLSYYRGD